MAGRGLGFGSRHDDYGNELYASDGSDASGIASSGDEQQRQGIDRSSKIRSSTTGRVSFVAQGVSSTKAEEAHDRDDKFRSRPSIGSASTSLPAEAAKWQKHTSGFAAKYLSKFGFKGRLGKNEQGMSQPVAVKARPDKLGLGAGGFKEATHLKQNRELVKELRATDPNAPKRPRSDDSSSGDSGLDSDEELSLAGGGRVASRKRPRRVYRTAAELLAGTAATSDNAASGGAAGPVIVDMTQGTARVVSSVSDLFTSSEGAPHPGRRRGARRGRDPLASGPAGLGQELLFNLGTLLGAAEADVKGANSKLLGTKRRLATVRSDSRLLQEAVESAQGQVQTLEAAQSAWQVLVEALESTGAAAAAQVWACAECVLGAMAALFLGHTAVCIRLQLPAVIPGVLAEVLHSAVHKSWGVTDHGDIEALLHFLRACSKFVELVALRLHEADVGARGSAEGDSDDGVDHSTELYKACAAACSASLVPRLRALMHQSEWDPRSQSSPVVAFLRAVFDSSQGEADAVILAPAPLERWLQLDVLPTVHRALEDWTPATDPVPLFAWLSLWKGVPEAYVQLEGGLRTAVAKVQSALADWEPSDASAEPMVRKLAALLPPKPLQQALSRCVTPKLVALLKNEAASMRDSGHWWHVSPAVHLVFQWAEVLPDAEMVALLCTDYLPSWVAAANAAFQQNTPLRDTTQHLSTFMDSLPLVVSQATVVQKFVLLLLRVASIAASKALDVQVDAALPTLPLPLPLEETRGRLVVSGGGSLKEPVPQSTQTKARPPDGAFARTGVPGGAAWGSADAPQLSLQEATAHVAAQRGLEFLPARQGKKINGQQVFVLGQRNVFFAKGLVWVEDSASGQYRPSAVEDLLRSM